MALRNLEWEGREVANDEVWIAGQSGSCNNESNIRLALNRRWGRGRVKVDNSELQRGTIHWQVNGCSKSIDDADSRALKDNAVTKDWPGELGDAGKHERVDFNHQIVRWVRNSIVDTQI